MHQQFLRPVVDITEKASRPINLYGVTKLTSDKFFIASNFYGVAFATYFGIVYYRIVMGSREFITPFFFLCLSKVLT